MPEPGADGAPTPPDAAEPAADGGAGAPAPDPRMPPLLRPGQRQNLWDRLPPSPRPGRAPDLRACVRRLARAAPLRTLPRLPRRGFNRAVTLILDRPAALRPVWDDLRLAGRSLATLLGDELQAFLLPAGPAGPWLPYQPRPVGRTGRAEPGGAFAPPGTLRTRTMMEGPVDPGTDGPQAGPLDAENECQQTFGTGRMPRPAHAPAARPLRRPPPGPDAISTDALVVLIGAFGALDTGVPAPTWQRLWAQLRATGHPLLLVPVCPLRPDALPASLSLVPLDPDPGRVGRGADETALTTLLAALSQTWLPTPARLRHRAIPGADLYTELCP